MLTHRASRASVFVICVSCMATSHMVRFVYFMIASVNVHVCEIVSYTENAITVIVVGGNGSSLNNDTEDEEHEFFDAVEEGTSSGMEDKNSFVIKVPVS